MTRAEKIIVLGLVLFLLLGTGVRVIRYWSSRVDLNVAHSENITREIVIPKKTPRARSRKRRSKNRDKV